MTILTYVIDSMLLRSMQFSPRLHYSDQPLQTERGIGDPILRVRKLRLGDCRDLAHGDDVDGGMESLAWGF